MEVLYTSDWSSIPVSINLFVFNIYEINNPDVLLHTFLPHVATRWLIVLIIVKPMI